MSKNRCKLLFSIEKSGAGAYRYGFSGKENDNEVKGEGNQQDYGMRIYDPRLGRFLSTDPLTQEYPFYTPYQFAGNTPIQAIDLDGAEPSYVIDWKGSDNDYTKKENRKALGQALIKVATLTDLNDATVIATTFTRNQAVNIDGTNASIWDKGFAYFGAVVPFVSGSMLKQGVKQGAKASIRMFNTMRYGGKVADAIYGGSTALRGALIKGGEKLLGKEAHHLIPTQLLTENKVVQDAVNAGFDFNGKVNGIGLTKVAEDGVHANHPNYTNQITDILNEWAEAHKGYKPEEAKKQLESLAGKLKNKVQKESAEGGKKVNDLKIN